MISEEALVNSGKTLFAQLMDFLPWSTFEALAFNTLARKNAVFFAFHPTGAR